MQTRWPMLNGVGGSTDMNYYDHEQAFNTGRYKCQWFFAKLLAAVVFVSILAPAQSDIDNPAVCPLSEAQTQKSIEAFGKIIPTLVNEPRCVNCHGGVNAFMNGFGKEKNPDLSDGAAEAPGSG